MNPTALAFLSAKILATISFCDMPITIVDELPNDALAQTDGYVIELSTEIRRSELAWAITHECMHQVHFRHLDDKDLYMFGRAPYVTEYAKESFDEDVAETLTMVYLGEVVRGPKGAFARKVIRGLAIPPM